MNKRGGITLLAKDAQGTLPVAYVLGTLIGDGSKKQITLSVETNDPTVLLFQSGTVSVLPKSSYTVSDDGKTVNLVDAPPGGSFVLVTTAGKLLFEELYAFSNMPTAESRSVTDVIYVIADSERLQNVVVTAQQYNVPGLSTISFGFSTDGVNFVPTLTISQIPKGQARAVYCRAVVPANLELGSYINYAISVTAEEVP